MNNIDVLHFNRRIRRLIGVGAIVALAVAVATLYVTTARPWTVVVIDAAAVPVVGAEVSVTMVRTGERNVCRTSAFGACDVPIQMPVRLEVTAGGHEDRTIVIARELEAGYVLVLNKMK